VGAGAIGGFYGGKLAQAGAHVSTVVRSDYQVVVSQGFRITSSLGDFTFRPERVLRSAAEADYRPDFILVATKVLPQVSTADLIRPAVGEGTTIVLIQNGIEIESSVAEAFPNNELISGLAFIAVSRSGPGRIHHQDFGRLTIGVYPTGTSDRARLLKGLLESVGVSCEITPDIAAARWEKLLWNAPFNPISVLAGAVDTREILSNEAATALVRKVMEDVCAIAASTGHELPESIIERYIENTAAMKPYKTSMLRDYEAKRPLEVEAMLGNAIRIAARTDVHVPHLQTLYALLKLSDEKNRSAGTPG
jgi:2-dehydropantoate 2-reductase